MELEQDMQADIDACWAIVKAQVFAKGAGVDLLPESTRTLVETAFKLGYLDGVKWRNEIQRETERNGL